MVTLLQSVFAEGDNLTIDAGTGDDILDASGLGASCPDQGIDETNQIAVTLIGGAGNDRLVGTPFDDVLDGGTGSDTYTGGEGLDVFRDAQVQRIQHGATGGTFTITFDGQTTAALAWNATAADVESALEALSNVTDVTVTNSSAGGVQTWTVTFLAVPNESRRQDLPLMRVDGSL